MRWMMLGLVALAGVAETAAAQDGPRRGPVFISPMGEPFRGQAPHDQWFDGADTNNDGVLTPAEMEADAARFFVLLDQRRDGEIDPDDIERYENVIAPEIRVGGGLRRDGHAGGGNRGRGRGGAPGRDGEPDGPREGRLGAARFGYFDYPEPVTVADRNFNRGVDAQEFRKAAETRFGLLDKNGDGRLEKGELPRLAIGAPRGDGKAGRQPMPPAQ